jgi:hypothetical protein
MHQSKLQSFISRELLRKVLLRNMLVRNIFCFGTVVLAVAGICHGQASRTFRGEISDSQCAMNVHSLTKSHQEMLKSKTMGGTSNTCSVYCIEHLGGYLVLSVGNDVYRIDRPDLVHGFEGRRVVLEGILDSKAKQIHVQKIDLEEKP